MNKDGLDPQKVLDYKAKTGSVVGYPGSTKISNEKILEIDCDILVPAALENVITKENAGNIKAKIVGEAANGPTTPEADDILYKNNVFLIPDILCNAGGVTVSYFEWVQGLQKYFWTEDEVNRRLEKIMVDAFHSVHDISSKKKVNMRKAAYILALRRIADAMSIRGIYP